LQRAARLELPHPSHVRFVERLLGKLANAALPSKPYIDIDYHSPTHWQQFYMAKPAE
jgi:hypothetical protein